MRVLLLDAEAKEKCATVMAYARAHIFDPSENGLVPGDNPDFVCHLGTYRCCFTYTRDHESGHLYRHLSISVPSKDYPNPEAACAIAGMFGFTGPENGLEAQLAAGKWLMRIQKEEPHCIVLAEELIE